MTARILRLLPSRFLFVTALAVAALAAAAVDAGAACFTSFPQAQSVQLRLQPRLQAQGKASAQASDKAADANQIVGMWAAEFLTAAGVWDQGFELFHADGTEVAVDNAVPPALGNVCVGVWKSAGPGTVKLRHMTWNWNPDGSKAGTFLLLVTATVSRDGNVYEGTFVSDSFDVDGNIIPDWHAEGTVRGTRITVD